MSADSSNNNQSTGSGSTASSAPATTTTSASSNVGVSTASCGNITWSPAGPAPGAFTSDSTQQVNEAVQVMNIDRDSAQYVAVHKFCAGDDTPNGWIVGSSWSEANGVRVTANFLPAGVCIDYDPGATTISGEVYHTEVQNPKWSRTQIMSDGSASGLKFTVYWTPCEFFDGTPSWDGNTTSQAAPSSAQPAQAAPAAQSQAPSGSTCPTSAEIVAQRTGSNASDWKQHPTYSNGWVKTTESVIGPFEVPSGGKVDFDGGSLESGTVPAGSAFTYWCPK